MQPLRSFGPAIGFVLLAIAIALLSNIPQVQSLFTDRSVAYLLALVGLVVCAYVISRFAPKLLHPFVWAMLFGMALQHPFAILTQHTQAFVTMVQLLAAFVLFAAGLSVPTKNFKKYFVPIASLSLIGTILSILLFSYALASLTAYFSLLVPPLSLIVLAAILASIDPTAVKSALENLRFVRPFLRDIVMSEGAVNDVVGIVLSRFFIVASLGAGSAYASLSVTSGFGALTTIEAVEPLALEVVWGILVGLLGYAILKTWGASVRNLHWSDIALFAIVPLFCFALGSLVGGAGYLAAFVAGLLYEVTADVEKVRSFFDYLVTHTFKPMLFILIGVIVPLASLYDLLPLGVAAALVFMFVIRPLVVYLSLLPWVKFRPGVISWREVLFLSFVRETGAISAALLLIAVTLGLASSELVLVIGVWVILLTLVIEPPLTPLIAQKLEVADQ